MDNLNNKLSNEAQSQPSCLGAVITSAKTPIQKLIDYMDFNRVGEDGENFDGKLMAKAIELLNEERELLKSFYLKGDSNGCGCYDYSTDKDAEDYFNQKFPTRYS
jgi:hypothetical protein